MKKLPILAVALAPFMAMAEPDSNPQGSQQSSEKANSQAKVEKQKLQQATPVTAILDKEVFSEQGEEVGNLEDIVITSDGKVKNFVVNVDMQHDDESQQGGQQSDRQASRQQAEQLSSERDIQQPSETELTQASGPDDGSQSQSSEPVEQQVSIEPQAVQYDSQNKRVTVGMQDLQQAGKRVYEEARAQDEMKLSEVVGMDVSLQDKQSYGEVEDVMLSKDNSEVVALVVDNWEGLEKSRRALPMQDAQIDVESGEVSYKYNVSDVQQLPEFNLDNYKDDGWDMTDWTD